MQVKPRIYTQIKFPCEWENLFYYENSAEHKNSTQQQQQNITVNTSYVT